MIEMKLLPDGAGSVPAEARDDSILATHLQNDGDPELLSVDDTENIASSWRDVTRIIPGHGDFILIRVPGQQADYSQTTLDGFRDAIIDNITGLKTHPDGWTQVRQPE